MMIPHANREWQRVSLQHGRGRRARRAVGVRWARAILEDSAGVLGQVVWRGPVGLRLRRGPDRIAGWGVAACCDDWIVMQARGLSLTAELVIQASPGRASVATLIRYDHSIAAVIWPALAVAHRIGLPVLLGRACVARR